MINFMLSKKRDEPADKVFFIKAIGSSGLSEKVTMDKSGSNIVEQDHRCIKRITNQMMSFKDFHFAKATLAGIELCRMLKKGQHVNAKNSPAFEQFYALAA